MTEKKSRTRSPEYGVGSARAAGIVADNTLLLARQGHGFAAERANHLIDVGKGKRAHLVGDDFAKAGPDRLVDGIEIQSKYCATPKATVNSCFSRSGKLIYQTRGRPMKIEVPKDQYPEVVKLMAKKLQTADVTAAAARKQARSIVVEGNVEYATARRIVEAGSIDSITFDVANGAMSAGIAGSVSVTIAYARAIWDGADAETALRAACATGLKVGGVTWLSSVLAAQISRTGVQALTREGSGWLVKQLGSKATLTIASALGAGQRAAGTELVKQGAARLTGKAAERFLTKAMSANVVTAAATTAILSAGDLCRVFSGHISKAQLFKNVSNTAAGVGGGMAGASAGAAQGAIYLGWVPGGPAVGAAVGALVGSLVAGTAAAKVARGVTDLLIEDDAVEMMGHLERVFVEEAQDYLLTQAEANRVMEALRAKWDLREQMREMHASVNPEQYARWLLRPLVQAEAKRRKKVRTPSETSLLKRVAKLLAEPVPELPGHLRSLEDDPAPLAGATIAKAKAKSAKPLIAAAAWPFPTGSRR